MGFRPNRPVGFFPRVPPTKFDLEDGTAEPEAQAELPVNDQPEPEGMWKNHRVFPWVLPHRTVSLPLGNFQSIYINHMLCVFSFEIEASVLHRTLKHLFGIGGLILECLRPPYPAPKQ